MFCLKKFGGSPGALFERVWRDNFGRRIVHSGEALWNLLKPLGSILAASRELLWRDKRHMPSDNGTRPDASGKFYVGQVGSADGGGRPPPQKKRVLTFSFPNFWPHEAGIAYF